MNHELFTDTASRRFFYSLNQLMTKKERLQWNEIFTTLAKEAARAKTLAKEARIFSARKSYEAAFDLEVYIRRIPLMEERRKQHKKRGKKAGVKHATE
jgi:hypothetical protein